MKCLLQYKNLDREDICGGYSKGREKLNSHDGPTTDNTLPVVYSLRCLCPLVAIFTFFDIIVSV